MNLNQIKSLVRDVPDFPKPGIVFKDISPMLAQPGALAWTCEALARHFEGQGIQKVLAIESRGFFFGVGIAERLRAGLVPVRKKGKLPGRTVHASYALEYGEAALELQADALKRGDKVLLVDDVLATGGTLEAAARLAGQLGAEVVGAACFLELGFLNGRTKLPELNLKSLWRV